MKTTQKRMKFEGPMACKPKDNLVGFSRYFGFIYLEWGLEFRCASQINAFMMICILDWNKKTFTANFADFVQKHVLCAKSVQSHAQCHKLMLQSKCQYFLEIITISRPNALEKNQTLIFAKQ